MALNRQTFRTRSVSAIVFGIIMIAGLLSNRWTFFALFSIIHFGCWLEYLALIEKIHSVKFGKFFKPGMSTVGFGLVLFLSGSGFNVSHYALDANLSFPVSLGGFLLLVFGVFTTRGMSIKAFGAALLGLLYISLSIGLMIGLWGSPEDMPFYFVLPCMIIASIWINDTMAYIVGSLIGKTQMSKISPKKTWEGTIGGVILSVVVVALVFGIITRFYLSEILFAAGIAAIASVVGSVGDLLESKLKRMAGVKDSGKIMPGHGGFLDRFDSLLLATPFVWIYLYFCLFE